MSCLCEELKSALVKLAGAGGCTDCPIRDDSFCDLSRRAVTCIELLCDWARVPEEDETEFWKERLPKLSGVRPHFSDPSECVELKVCPMCLGAKVMPHTNVNPTFTASVKCPECKGKGQVKL